MVWESTSCSALSLFGLESFIMAFSGELNWCGTKLLAMIFRPQTQPRPKCSLLHPSTNNHWNNQTIRYPDAWSRNVPLNSCISYQMPTHAGQRIRKDELWNQHTYTLLILAKTYGSGPQVLSHLLSGTHQAFLIVSDLCNKTEDYDTRQAGLFTYWFFFKLCISKLRSVSVLFDQICLFVCIKIILLIQNVALRIPSQIFAPWLRFPRIHYLPGTSS